MTKRQKIRTLIISASVICCLCCAFLAGAHYSDSIFIEQFTKPKITAYNNDEVSYVCSRPIRSKMGVGEHMLGKLKELVPADPAEAARYCTADGIE